jgi:hypothetical protein
MTVRDPQDNTEGVFITQQKSEKIDNQEITRQTLVKLEKIVKVLGKAEEHPDDKFSMAWHLKEFCNRFKRSKDYAIDELALRQLAIIELENERQGVAPGLYIFLPVMSRDWITEIMRDSYNAKKDEIDAYVICWYTSYSGKVSLNVFNYPFKESTYLELLKDFADKDLDNLGDLDTLNFISHEIFDYDDFLEFSPNNDAGLRDKYLLDSDIDPMGSYNSNLQMPLFPDSNY